MARNWTPEERERQSAIIREREPWKNSTGPKTMEGKKTVSQNACVHGFDSAQMDRIREILRLQRRYLKIFKARMHMKHEAVMTEVIKKRLENQRARDRR